MLASSQPAAPSSICKLSSYRSSPRRVGDCEGSLVGSGLDQYQTGDDKVNLLFRGEIIMKFF